MSETTKAKPSYPRPSWQSTLLQISVLVGIIALTYWAADGIGIEMDVLEESPTRIKDFLERMYPPDGWEEAGYSIDMDNPTVQVAKDATVETLRVAILGTIISIILSFPLGMLAASNLTPIFVYTPVRILLSVIRAIPVIVLGLLFVSAVGFGALPGLLAITFHSTGMLAKFYADAFENARRGPIEALDSAGATWFQRIRFGVFTQVTPDLVRDSLFRLELNIRDSAVLGIVGAGGIGFYIQTYARSFQYTRMATVTLAVILLTFVVEQISVVIRKRLR